MGCVPQEDPRGRKVYEYSLLDGDRGGSHSTRGRFANDPVKLIILDPLQRRRSF